LKMGLDPSPPPLVSSDDNRKAWKRQRVALIYIYVYMCVCVVATVCSTSGVLPWGAVFTQKVREKRVARVKYASFGW